MITLAATQKTIYITGITGTIGRILATGLQERYRVRGNARRAADVPGAEVAVGDVSDGAFMREQLEGVDTLIHLAADPSPWADWSSLLTSNIDGTYQVYEAARLAGVERIIFASTNHVTGILTEQVVDMDVNVPVRPDSLYGVSKSFGEALGRYYSDRYGLSVLNFRIGWLIGERPDDEVVAFFKDRRDAYPLMWLSPRDCVHAHVCGIEAPRELRLGTYYIMSNNRDMLWDMENAREELGYRPQDDLAVLFDKAGVPYDFRIPSGELGG